MSIRKKLQKINSVNSLYFRIIDMKGQFKKGKSDNVWYLIIFGDADVLRKFANIWKSIRTKVEENTGGSVFAQNGKFYPQLFVDDGLYKL